jgi:hypothetical protein
MGGDEIVILVAIGWKSMYLYKTINIPLNEISKLQLCAIDQDSSCSHVMSGEEQELFAPAHKQLVLTRRD